MKARLKGNESHEKYDGSTSVILRMVWFDGLEMVDSQVYTIYIRKKKTIFLSLIIENFYCYMELNFSSLTL